MSDHINVEFVYPPIPCREMDYRATFEDYEPGDLVGWGKNANAAKADLLASKCRIGRSAGKAEAT